MLKNYKKYQLEWMISHGYSLDDLINKMDDMMPLKQILNLQLKMLEDNPYDFNKYKDLVCLFCSKQETPFDESTLYEFHFFVERFWLEKYVLENYNVINLQEWLEEIYTSDESIYII